MNKTTIKNCVRNIEWNYLCFGRHRNSLALRIWLSMKENLSRKAPYKNGNLQIEPRVL